MFNLLRILSGHERIPSKHYAEVTRAANAQASGTGLSDKDYIANRQLPPKADWNLIAVTNMEAVDIPQGSVFQISYSGVVQDQSGYPSYQAYFLQSSLSTANVRISKPVLCVALYEDIAASGGVSYAKIIGYDQPLPVLIDTSKTPVIGDTCGPLFMPTPTGVSFTKGKVCKGGNGLTCLSAPNTDDFPYTAVLVVATREQDYEGYLTSNLAAPASNLVAPTTATCMAWVPDIGDSSTPRKNISTTNSFTVVNRDPQLTASTGDYINFRMINGEYRILGSRPRVTSIHQGIVTSATTAATTDSWVNPKTITVTEYVPDSTKASGVFVGSGVPWGFVVGTGGLTVIVRDKMFVPIGAFVQWIETAMPDGSIERELTWVRLPIIHQGVTTAALTTAATNYWTGATTVAATEYNDNPSATNSPRTFIAGSTGLSIVVRDNITIPQGTYIEWIERVLADGTIERELTWVRPQSTFHQGRSLNNSTAIASSWTGAYQISAIEYADDPAASNTPRTFIAASGGRTTFVMVRSNVKIRADDYIQWQTIQLSDGTTENELTWVQEHPTFHNGVVISGITTPNADSWTTPQEITVQEYVPGSTANDPWPFVVGSTYYVVVREKIVVPVGAYVQWYEYTLPNGTIERELTWVKPASNATFHQGQTTAAYAYSGTTPRWVRTAFVTCQEYIDDPSAINSPRDMIPTGSIVNVAIRSIITSIPAGTYVQWQTVVLSDGSHENQLTGADC